MTIIIVIILLRCLKTSLFRSLYVPEDSFILLLFIPFNVSGPKCGSETRNCASGKNDKAILIAVTKLRTCTVLMWCMLCSQRCFLHIPMVRLDCAVSFLKQAGAWPLLINTGCRYSTLKYQQRSFSTPCLVRYLLYFMLLNNRFSSYSFSC